jgi:hypothetical protein
MGKRFGIVSPPGAALLVVAALLLASWGGGGGGRGSRGEAAGGSGPDSLTASISLNEGGYAMGEPIVMTLEVVNPTDRSIRLTFPSAQRYDFVVKQAKATIWQYSGGRMFAQVLGRYDLAPGDTMAYKYTWDQTGADGTKPRLGAYTVEGMLMISPPLKTGAKTFGIVD